MKIAVLEMSNSDEVRFAIQLESGAFWGQKWKKIGDHMCRQYPVWKTARGALNKLDKLRLEQLELERLNGFSLEV